MGGFDGAHIGRKPRPGRPVFPESNNHYEAASAARLIHKPPHSNTHCQAQAQERRHGRGPALAHQRQRDTGDRQEADHHPDIHRSLKEQNRRKSYNQESSRAVTGRLRSVQKAQQQREVKQKHQQSPNETLFLGKGREDEVGLGNGYESQPALRPISDALAPKAARPDGNPGLRTLVAGTLRVLRRMNGMHRRSSCRPSHFLGHEADGGGIAKVVMPLAAHPFNMVVGHFVA